MPVSPYRAPYLGAFGLTEQASQQRGYDVKTGSFKFGILGLSRIAGDTEGFVRIVFEQKYGEVLGVHMIGPRATELVAEATLALCLDCSVQ